MVSLVALTFEKLFCAHKSNQIIFRIQIILSCCTRWHFHLTNASSPWQFNCCCHFCSCSCDLFHCCHWNSCSCCRWFPSCFCHQFDFIVFLLLLSSLSLLFQWNFSNCLMKHHCEKSKMSTTSLRETTSENGSMAFQLHRITLVCSMEFGLPCLHWWTRSAGFITMKSIAGQTMCNGFLQHACVRTFLFHQWQWTKSEIEHNAHLICGTLLGRTGLLEPRKFPFLTLPGCPPLWRVVDSLGWKMAHWKCPREKLHFFWKGNFFIQSWQFCISQCHHLTIHQQHFALEVFAFILLVAIEHERFGHGHV